jgi:hypothetical protein
MNTDQILSIVKASVAMLELAPTSPLVSTRKPSVMPGDHAIGYSWKRVNENFKEGQVEEEEAFKKPHLV